MSAVNAIPFLDTTPGDQALALELYTGLFSDAWRSRVFLWDTSLPVVTRKFVPHGQSHQFLMMADVPDAEEFTPGDELLGQNYAVDEDSITPDQYLVAHKAIGRDQMAKSHFEILSKLAKANARKIAQKYDLRLFSIGCQAARASAVTKDGLTVHNGGNRVTRSGTAAVSTAYPASATGASNLRADLRTLAQRMDEDNIPPEGRYLWLRPDMKTVLLFDSTAQVFSFDYIKGSSAGNSINDRELMKLEGFIVVDFPNTQTNGGPFPDSNITTDRSKYNANFTIGASNGTPVALALCAGPDGGSAIGVVSYESVFNVVKYYENTMSWLVYSALFVGADILEPYCAGSVEVIV